MKIDRTRFLLLTSTLAAASATAVVIGTGCTTTTTSTPSNDAGNSANDGSLQPELDATVVDAGDGAVCIADLLASDAGDAGDASPGGPTCEGTDVKCPSECYLATTSLKGPVAQEVNTCLNAAATCEGGRTTCVLEALAKTCADPTATTFCTPLVAACAGTDAGYPADASVPAFNQTNCEFVVRGMSAEGRETFQACVTGEGGSGCSHRSGELSHVLTLSVRIPPPPSWHRDMLTVGVTGTNGKTTTTAWIASALRILGGPVFRPTTVGYFLDDEEIDVARNYDGFICGMKMAHDRGGRFAAIEMTSEALAKGFARAWPCRVGVFTNLTHDHLDAHGSPEHYLASKAQLFVGLGAGDTAVLNACDESYELLREVIDGSVSVLAYGVPARGPLRTEDALVAEEVAVGWDGTRIALAARAGFPRELFIRAIGRVYAENALAAVLGAVAAGVRPEDATRAVAETPPPPGRFEVVHARPFVVVDYAHSPDALARTVAAARELAKDARLTVVFGAGGNRDRAKRAPMGAAARLADHVILTSDNPRDEDPRAIADAIAGGLEGHPSVRVELERARAIELAVAEAGPEDVVLVAGKGHEAEQTIAGVTRSFSDRDVACAAARHRADGARTS